MGLPKLERGDYSVALFRRLLLAVAIASTISFVVILAWDIGYMLLATRARNSDVQALIRAAGGKWLVLFLAPFAYSWLFRQREDILKTIALSIVLLGLLVMFISSTRDAIRGLTIHPWIFWSVVIGFVVFLSKGKRIFVGFILSIVVSLGMAAAWCFDDGIGQWAFVDEWFAEVLCGRYGLCSTGFMWVGLSVTSDSVLAVIDKAQTGS